MNKLKSLIVVFGLVLVGINCATLEAGLFSRCRHRRSRCDCQGIMAAAPTYGNCALGTTCLNFPYANHTSYCSYYSTVCNGTGGVSMPCNWDDVCGIPPGGCSNCPSGSCKPPNYARKKTCSSDSQQFMDGGLATTGMMGDKPAPADLTNVDSSAKPDKKEGTLVKLNTAGKTLIVCQLWEVDVDPKKHNPVIPGDKKKFFIGHEVAAAPTGEMDMIADGDRTWDEHFCCLKYKGKFYSVVSHSTTK